MGVIPETCVPDGSYSRNVRTWWKLLQKCAYMMEVTPETCVPDGSYSRNMRTWWKLLQKRVVLTKLDIYVFINKAILPLIKSRGSQEPV